MLTFVQSRFVADPSQAKGVSAVFEVLMGGVPNLAGFYSTIETNNLTNFGAGPGPSFNEENVFINLANALIQGNASAGSTFQSIASGNTLREKVEAIYRQIIPEDQQSDEGLNYLTRPEGLQFYESVALERGVTGPDGAGIVALASLLKVAVDQNIGVGVAVNEFVAAVNGGYAVLPEGGDEFTPLVQAVGDASIHRPEYEVTVHDTTGLLSSFVDDIKALSLHAAAEWQSHFVKSAEIEISITLQDIPSNRADGRSPQPGAVDSKDGRTVSQDGAAFEIQTGMDTSGSSADVEIRIDPDYIDELWFDATPSRGDDIPSNQLDARSVFIHELGHAFGFNGLRNWETGALPPEPFMSTYDAAVVLIDGAPYFTGANARSIYGSDVPLTKGNLTHYGNANRPEQADLVAGIMNGVVFEYGKRYEISQLDLAFLQDTGLDIIGFPIA